MELNTNTIVWIILIIVVVIIVYYMYTRNKDEDETFSPSMQILLPGAGRQVPGTSAYGKQIEKVVNMPMRSSTIFG